MISPAFATMLCFVETDAALAPEHRRPAARRVRQALVRPHLGRRSALDQRHRDPAGQRRQRRPRRAPSQRPSCAWARRSTRCCGGWRCRSCATARARGGSAASPSRAGTSRPSCASARAIANSPLVKTALHGGDPNWGRIAQAVGRALPGTAPLPLRHLGRGRPGVRGRARAAPRRGGAGRGRAGRGGRVRGRASPARAPRSRCSSPTSRTSTSGSTRTTRHEPPRRAAEAACAT